MPWQAGDLSYLSSTVGVLVREGAQGNLIWALTANRNTSESRETGIRFSQNFLSAQHNDQERTNELLSFFLNRLSDTESRIPKYKYYFF